MKILLAVFRSAKINLTVFSTVWVVVNVNNAFGIVVPLKTNKALSIDWFGITLVSVEICRGNRMAPNQPMIQLQTFHRLKGRWGWGRPVWQGKAQGCGCNHNQRPKAKPNFAFKELIPIHSYLVSQQDTYEYTRDYPCLLPFETSETA